MQEAGLNHLLDQNNAGMQKKGDEHIGSCVGSSKTNLEPAPMHSPNILSPTYLINCNFLDHALNIFQNGK
jgi:hypothetical protein